MVPSGQLPGRKRVNTKRVQPDLQRFEDAPLELQRSWGPQTPLSLRDAGHRGDRHSWRRYLLAGTLKSSTASNGGETTKCRPRRRAEPGAPDARRLAARVH